MIEEVQTIAPLRLPHRRQRRTDDAQHALEIDLERMVPFLVAHLRPAAPDARSRRWRRCVERAGRALSTSRPRLGPSRLERTSSAQELGRSAASAPISPATVFPSASSMSVTTTRSPAAAKARARRAADADAAAGDQNLVSSRAPSAPSQHHVAGIRPERLADEERSRVGGEERRPRRQRRRAADARTGARDDRAPSAIARPPGSRRRPARRTLSAPSGSRRSASSASENSVVSTPKAKMFGWISTENVP